MLFNKLLAVSLQFDFAFNIYRTLKQEQQQCPACDKIAFWLPRHLCTGIHKSSDDSAKNAANHFGIRKRKKMEIKIKGNPRNVVTVRLWCKGLIVMY